MSRFSLLFCIIYLAGILPAAAQDPADERLPTAAPEFASGTPERGLNWQPPASLEAAERDLREMRMAGVTSVRTGIIRDHRLLSVADTLGIRLHMDLPIARLAAVRLIDTLAYASAVLDTVAGLAQIHSSIQSIGLASYVDTSDSTACAYFAALRRRARAAAPQEMRVYYLTHFLEHDRCAAEVDLVLVDVRDMEDPTEPLRKWAAAGNATLLGIGAIGTWLRVDTLRGLLVDASPERQARYFETHLPILLSDTLSLQLPVIFVHRWRDVRLPYPTTSRDLNDPFMDIHGLHTIDDVPRPALDVVRGIYTGRQSVFAFEAGRPLRDSVRWPMPIGWAVILMLGTFYALSPRFRHMVPRYFRAHFFFRESVREGRDVLFGASAMLLTSLGAAAGVVSAVVLHAIRDNDAFVMAVRWLPPTIQALVLTLLGEPLVLIFLVGCVYALMTLVWTVVLAVFSRRRFRIAPAQGMMLILWPRWPLLIVLIAAMVVANMSSPGAIHALALAGGWILISLAAALRTVIDFEAVTRVPVYWLLPVILFHPVVPLLIVGFFMIAPFEHELNFLRHMITRR